MGSTYVCALVALVSHFPHPIIIFPPINLAPHLWVLIAMFGVDERVCPGSHHFFLFFTPAHESSTPQQLFDQPIFRTMAYYSLFYSNSVPFSKFVLIFNSAFLLATYFPFYVRYCKHDSYVLYHLSYCAVGWGGGAADWFCPPLCVFAIVAWLEGIT